MYKNNCKSISGISLVSVFLFLLIFLTTSNRVEAQSKPWPVPPQASSIKNPIQADPATLKDGKVLYSTYCSPCHGDKGKGDGPAASALNPKPADHTTATVQNETDGTIYYKLSTGRSPMPGYQKILTDNQRWELVAYIRTLIKNGKK
jgi:mono/diheme cytochrome c family protein